MADIAFLLLIFFLVTTTMDTEIGILRILPPAVEESEPVDVARRNVFEVLVNDADGLLVEQQPLDIQQLRTRIKEFLTNPTNSDQLPQKQMITSQLVQERLGRVQQAITAAPTHQERIRLQKEFEEWQERKAAVRSIGEYQELPAEAIISLQTGSRTTYATYVLVQNELEAAVRELRDELALRKFGKGFSELSESLPADRTRIKAIRRAFPQRIAEVAPLEVATK